MKYSEQALRLKKLAGLMAAGDAAQAPPASALSTAPTPPGKFQGTDMRPDAANQAPPLDNPDVATVKAATQMDPGSIAANQGVGPAFMRQAGQAGAPAPAPKAPVRAPAPQPTRAGIPVGNSMKSTFPAPTKTSQDSKMSKIEHPTVAHLQSTKQAAQLIDRLVKGASAPGGELVARLVKGAALLGDSKGSPDEARDALSADFLGMGHPSDAADRIKPGVGKSQLELIRESKGKTAEVSPWVTGAGGAAAGGTIGAISGAVPGVAVGAVGGLLYHLLAANKDKKRTLGGSVGQGMLAGAGIGGAAMGGMGAVNGGMAGYRAGQMYNDMQALATK